MTVAPVAEQSLLATIRHSIIGEDHVLTGPFGARRITYVDYTASGRALSFIEGYIRGEVLPWYANTHSESSGTGLITTGLREEARAIIRDCVGADQDSAVIFAGSGSTGAIAKLVGILGLRLPSALDARYGLARRIPAAERPVVFIGPYEHHSNELPWRESIADVVAIPQDGKGGPCQPTLAKLLAGYADRPLRIGSFSAASNVTGIITDTDAITRLLHEHGALAFWDYAAAGPYLEIAMGDRSTDPLLRKDAIFLSPHKFVGGPGTPGVLVARKELFTNRVPDTPGGGTVSYVNASEHRYVHDPEEREEGGTPGIVESIRAGLIFQLKRAVGTSTIEAQERSYLHRALGAWTGEPAIRILGDPSMPRLPIISFVVAGPRGRQLHHNFVVALLSDLFGIQVRGGCSCAGPYGHRLLDIDTRTSRAFERLISEGYAGIKPGWVRLNLPYFLSEQVLTYLIRAVILVARHGWRLLDDYTFDIHDGLWRHRRGAVDTSPRLADITYTSDGRMAYAATRGRVSERVLPRYLREASRILAEKQVPDLDAPLSGLLPADVESLRWFELPRACLSSHSAASG